MRRSRTSAPDGPSGADERAERIYATVRDIPRGAVSSYGRIAALTGLPRGHRQVGHALRTLPKGSDVPWYRVVTASGRPAFEPGSRAFRRQVNLLKEEDVPVLNGKVNMKKYEWQPDLDELLWKPSPAWDETR